MKYNPYYELLEVEENKDHDDTKFSHNEPIESMEIIEECSSILENCKNFTILGDYNINLFEEYVPMKKFEENFMCTGFLPTISIAAHHKPNCLKSCIDNILIKNLDTDSLYTENITTHISHHNTLFAIINANSKLEDNTTVPSKKITHCYNDENIASPNTLL